MTLTWLIWMNDSRGGFGKERQIGLWIVLIMNFYLNEERICHVSVEVDLK